MASDPKLPVPFEPVPMRPRRDGWTAGRQEAFLKALAGCGCVAHAARSVGMSRQSAHDLYNHPAAAVFRRCWDAALDCSISLVEDGMWSRAINGVARPIFYQGEQVGEWRYHDERLAMFLLRFRRPHRFGHIPKLPPPAQPPGWVDEGADPDEAIDTLDFHLGDLVDVPEVSAADPGSIDGVNLVNFQPTEGSDADADAPPE
jgi:hypothetical protein